MLNMDFSQRVVIRTHEVDWAPSPAAGVERKPLVRESVADHAVALRLFFPVNDAGLALNHLVQIWQPV